MVQELGWHWIEVKSNLDGNSLFKCFAMEIYGNVNEYKNVKNACNKYFEENKHYFSKMAKLLNNDNYANIMAMSELYNVRAMTFELESETSKNLNISFECGDCDEAIDLPLIMLAELDDNDYSIIQSSSFDSTVELKELKEIMYVRICLNTLNLCKIYVYNLIGK